MPPSPSRWLLLFLILGCAPESLAQPADRPGRPRRGPDTTRPGPWDNDALVYQISMRGEPRKLATFERAGVPTAARLSDGRLIVAHQHFPASDDAAFDKVAVHFSVDEGGTWTPAQVIEVEGLPQNMRFPFDPTLVPLPDGRIRLYFTANMRSHEQDVRPAIGSAISKDGVKYTYEAGNRFEVKGRPVIDCAVVLHQGIFHLYAPDNGVAGPPGRPIGEGRDPAQRPREGVGYHATSKDGLVFERQADVAIDGQRRWLGNAQSDGQWIYFFGTGEGLPGTRGGVWCARSRDGAWFELDPAFTGAGGADPGAVQLKDGSWLVVVTGPPRPGTPSAQQRRPDRLRN